jgi:hypothetical protein
MATRAVNPPVPNSSSTSSQDNSKINKASAATRTHRLCRAQTRSGAPCRARASQGDFCSLHADPERASELGRLSGQSRRRSADIELTPREFEPPKTAKDVKAIIAQVLVDLCAGRMDPHTMPNMGVGRTLRFPNQFLKMLRRKKSKSRRQLNYRRKG